MKYVRKTGPPREYINWCNQVRGTEDEDYRRLDSEVKEKLLEALLIDQGYLCAYTMRKICEKSSHVEHIKPESLCRAERVGSDLDHSNLVACYPRAGMAKNCRYGAQQKADWWENDGVDFVSPLNQNCEERFRFDLEGNIEGVRKHRSAVKTIQVLRLDQQTLTEERRRVVQELIYGKSGSSPLSPAKTARSIQRICETDADGHFREYCIAIRDALHEHSRILKKLATKRKFARKR